MNRRSFLGSILAAAAAPAVVRADSLMRIVPRDTTIMLSAPEVRLPYLVNVKHFGAFGDGVMNDTAAINFALAQAAKMGAKLYFPAGNYMIDSKVALEVDMIVGPSAHDG